MGGSTKGQWDSIGRPKLPGIGSHHSAHSESDEWWTPPEILNYLGPFGLDPCAPSANPGWTGANTTYTQEEDGLTLPWGASFVWCNPPYSDIERWMAKMADHDNGLALVFARTETQWWFDSVWGRASSVLFLRGRVTFWKPTDHGAPDELDDIAGPIPDAPKHGPSKAGHNAGGPSALIAYGNIADDRLLDCTLPGALATGIRLR